MKTNLLIFVSLLMILSSCSKDAINDIHYPKTFTINHSQITNEKGFVIGDNESYTEISPRAGSLDSLRTWVALDYLGFLISSGTPSYLESFTLLSKDSVRLNARIDSVIQSVTLPANAEDLNGKLIDPVYFEGSTVKYNSNTQEIIVCQALSLGIVSRGGLIRGNLYAEFCKSNDIIKDLQNTLSLDAFVKNDTLGIYLIDMIYK